MKKIIMMFVYYDERGDIRAICPAPDGQFENQGCKYVTVPFPEVEDFLTSAKNPFNYHIETKRKNGVDIVKLLPKQVRQVSYLRSINNYLSEINYQNEEANAIIIENNVEDKILKIWIDPFLKIQVDDEECEDQEKLINFRSLPKINFYFTTKNDPSFLIKTISLEPKKLFSNSFIEISYVENLNEASLFTKKYFEYYSYIVKKGSIPWHSHN